MIQEYINHLGVNKGYSPCTLRAYEYDLLKFAKWAKGNVDNARWSAIDAQDIQAYVAALVANGEQPTSIRRHVTALRSFFRYQVHRGRLTANPAQYASTPKQAKRLPVTMSMTDIRAALDDRTANNETRAIVAIIAETGARIGEVLGMTWNDINRDTQTIRLHGKGQKERIVVYGQRTDEALSGMTRRTTGHLFADKTERDYRHDVWQLMRQHTAAEKCSPHIIRHAFACAHLEAGTDIKTLAVMMGHESVKTTEIYAQVAGAKLQQSFKNIQV